MKNPKPISGNLPIDHDLMNWKRQFPPLAFGATPETETDAEFINYVEVGKKIAEWALAADTSKWPNTVAEFKNQLGVGTHITISDAYTAFAIVQVVNSKPIDAGGMLKKAMSDNDYSGLTFLLRLPPSGQLKESIDIVKKLSTNYTPPPLYTVFILDLTSSPGGSTDSIYARVADYTMRGCR